MSTIRKPQDSINNVKRRLSFVMMDDEWMDNAACKEADTRLFFTDDNGGGRYDRARRICDKCPVISECLAYAIHTGSEHGMFGGLSPEERKERLKDGNSRRERH